MNWLADENFDNDIVRGILRRAPGIDIVRVQDIAEINGRDDVAVLNWATRHGRVLLTHDLSTMIPSMKALSSRCTPIVMVPTSLAVGMVIEDVLLLEIYAVDSDWSACVIYLPLE